MYKKHFPMVKKGKVVKGYGYFCGQLGAQDYTIIESEVTCKKCLKKINDIKKYYAVINTNFN